MKKLPSTLLNMTLVLTIIALVSAGGLAFAYKLTKVRIEKVAQEKQLQAITKVILPGFTNSPDMEVQNIKLKEGTLSLFPAKENGNLTSVAVQSFSNKGYGGKVVVMVGLTSDGKITNTSVLEQKETPGLGTKMETERFRSQFNGKGPANSNLTVKKDGGEVDAITAATISSRAFCDAIDLAYKAFIKFKENYHE